MSEFKKYKRTNIAEMRPIKEEEVGNGSLLLASSHGISVSAVDIDNGSPKIGDMIARNPENHEDKRLVAKKYFEDNFKEIPGQDKPIG